MSEEQFGPPNLKDCNGLLDHEEFFLGTDCEREKSEAEGSEGQTSGGGDEEVDRPGVGGGTHLVQEQSACDASLYASSSSVASESTTGLVIYIVTCPKTKIHITRCHMPCNQDLNLCTFKFKLVSSHKY